MKNTIVSAVVFVVLTFIFSKDTNAWFPVKIEKDIKLVVTIIPTATPTPIVFKQIDPNIDLHLLPTLKLTPTSTLEPTSNPELTVTQKPTMEDSKVTLSPIQEENLVTPEPSIAISEGEQNVEKEEIDLKMWLMGITIGLLLLIVVIQLWPKKKQQE
ncbi:MAG TPA: hypothetical protein VN174_04010 [Candidatus Methanoperedens sp.]|nr:hypothetical protein [Candidatus Methanoperedens sp.]